MVRVMLSLRIFNRHVGSCFPGAHSDGITMRAPGLQHNYSLEGNTLKIEEGRQIRHTRFEVHATSASSRPYRAISKKRQTSDVRLLVGEPNMGLETDRSVV
ncbi:hypothetical protein Ssi02_26280 [Sinosporangium siamense]|uniref:Uncharacterized protein n=1 Tax=Sinosporangium siamense TaxID=1367973 RepID=A0A919RFF4_9ACTN|nr:hypothetical protein Ssi02_26280 [Sinosporangium siamense]